MADDSDMAFDLQLQEALTASLLEAAATTASLSYDTALDGDHLAGIPNVDLHDYEQLLIDEYNAEAEAKRLQLELSREIHDRAFCCQILKIPEAEWIQTGGDFSMPFGEGPSTSGEQGMEFRVYVKGLVIGTGRAIAVVICDESDGLMFEMSKGFGEKGFNAAEEFFQLKALVEGLEIATVLGLKRILILTDCRLLFQLVAGENLQIPADFLKLSEQITVLLRKFTQIRTSLTTTDNIKFAYQLATSAIVPEFDHSAESSATKNITKSCSICLEDIYADQIFPVPGCQHSYCVPCIMKHVQYKLLGGVLPKCPHENCKSELKLDDCKTFLTPQLFDIMSQRVKEASIPVAEKVYCPYPRCSALLSKTDMQQSIHDTDYVVFALGGRKCPACSGMFCLKCRVPWHRGMNCFDFKRRNPQPVKEDEKLMSLANQNLWRQCPQCNHMISLAAGCYHIYCRCGHEFCYTCGAEWKDKKATCKCPVWDERNIVY